MKNYLLQFKPFLIFISTFFAAYIGLTLIYKFYLNTYQTVEVDGITAIVGHHVNWLMEVFNAKIITVKNLSNSYIEVWYNNRFVLKIVEGCNAVSVIILFISFIIAFSGKFKTTLLFILFGIFSIYVLNVIRIALLAVLLFHFPEREHIVHGVFFPLIIYGFVFCLWFIWVNKYSKYAK